TTKGRFPIEKPRVALAVERYPFAALSNSSISSSPVCGAGRRRARYQTRMPAARAPTIARSENEIHRILDGVVKAAIPNHVAVAYPEYSTTADRISLTILLI